MSAPISRVYFVAQPFSSYATKQFLQISELSHIQGERFPGFPPSLNKSKQIRLAKEMEEKEVKVASGLFPRSLENQQRGRRFFLS